MLGLGLGLSRSSFVGESLLLDTYSGAAAAYSLRKLDSDYSGSAIRVRRSSDNTEQDIGFTASGDLDESALTTFTGANDGFVVTWYDQSGNSRNATQGTAANQPQIVSSGSILVDNSKPEIDFNGTSHFLSLASTINNSGTETVIVVSNSDSTVNSKAILRFNTNTYYRISDLRGNIDYSYGFPVSNFSFSSNANQKLIFATSASGTKNVYQDGVASADNPIVDGSSSYSINRISSSSTPYDGGLQEIIIYASDQSANRTAIESNINSHYSIYP